jgi:hypothetical protein
MIRDLVYPDDARKEVDALQAGLEYDAAIALLGNACTELKVDGPNFSTIVRLGDQTHDALVRKLAPGLLSRFSLISMVSRFEKHARQLLRQRHVIEALGGTGKRMTADVFWPILRQTEKEARQGPVRLCARLLVKQPSAELLGRMKWLEGIYRVRNCLAHRLGVVEMEDVRPRGASLEQTQDTDKLTAVWLRPVVFVNGVEITALPHQGGGHVEIRFVEYERTWNIGDQVEVTPTDCQAIAMSLSLLANRLLADLEGELNALLAVAPVAPGQPGASSDVPASDGSAAS